MKRIKYWLKNIITNRRMCRRCCVGCEYYRDCVGEEMSTITYEETKEIAVEVTSQIGAILDVAKE